jgi:hypothetical protein
MSELLRIEQGHHKVAEQEDSDGEDGESRKAHGLPQLFAGGDVEKRNREKGDGVNDHQKVGHNVSSFSKTPPPQGRGKEAIKNS